MNAQALNFHDDNLLAVQVTPPRRRGEHATITIDLQEYSSGSTKRLTFSGSANIRWGMDFDVLAENWFGQTNRFTVLDDTGKLLSFVEGQRRLWGVQYRDPRSPDKPIRRKVENITRYRLFKLKFFGGKLEILAKRMKITNIATNP